MGVEQLKVARSSTKVGIHYLESVRYGVMVGLVYYKLLWGKSMGRVTSLHL